MRGVKIWVPLTYWLLRWLSGFRDTEISLLQLGGYDWLGLRCPGGECSPGGLRSLVMIRGKGVSTGLHPCSRLLWQKEWTGSGVLGVGSSQGDWELDWSGHWHGWDNVKIAGWSGVFRHDVHGKDERVEEVKNVYCVFQRQLHQLQISRLNFSPSFICP